MRWFGPDPFSPACLGTARAPIPLASCCAWCEEPFTADDGGYLIPHMGATVTELPYHVECWLRQIVGSVAHLEERCSCYGGAEDDTDPPELSKREAAQAAVDLFHQLHPRPA